MIVVMKSLLGLLALAVVSPSAAIDNVIPNFLSEDELAYFQSIPIAPGDIEVAVLKKSIAERIHSVRGGALTEAIKQDLRRSVAIKMMSETTDVHEDRSHFADGTVASMTEEDEVGFIFLDSNPDAAFHHGDKAVPASAGSLVTFKGKVPHNAVITNGSVRLAGPFHLNSQAFAIIGGHSPSGYCCTDDKDCEYESEDSNDGCEYECVCPGEDFEISCTGTLVPADGSSDKGKGGRRELRNRHAKRKLSKRLSDADASGKLSNRRANTARKLNHNSRSARKLEELHNAVVEEELKSKPSVRGLNSKSSKSSNSCGSELGECRPKPSKSSKSGSSCQEFSARSSF